MAIIKIVPGIEAVVLINGQKAQEYEEEGTAFNGHVHSHVNRYIQSIDDANFSIRILVNDEYKFERGVHDGLGIKVLVDGVYRCSAMWRMERPIEYMILSGGKVPRGESGAAIKAFKFTPISTVDGKGEDGERDRVERQKEDTKYTGEIEILITRLKINKVEDGLVIASGKMLETPHSKLFLKANHARGLTHGVGFGAEVEVSKATKKFSCTNIDGLNKSLASFVFMYRAEHILDERKVVPITEGMPEPETKHGGQMVVPQTPVESPKIIKKDPDAANIATMGDIYGATPDPSQRQVEAIPQAALSALAGNMEAVQDILISIGLTDEQKTLLALHLHRGVNNTAQNLPAPAPFQSVGAAAADDIQVKQEGSDKNTRPPNLNVALANRERVAYKERQTNNGIEIELTTPVEETFVKPDPDDNAQTSQTDGDAVMAEDYDEGLPRHNSSSTISGASVNAQSETTDEVIAPVDAELMVSPTREPERAANYTIGTRQASVPTATADGIVTQKTADTSIQEPAFAHATEAQADTVGSDGMVLQKAASLTGLFARAEAEIIASIEAGDRDSSITETVRQRKDSNSSDASMDLNAELQRARSSHPTITTFNGGERDRTDAMSSTPQPADDKAAFPDTDFMIAPRGAESRMTSISTQGVPVETVDVDMETGRDLRDQIDEEDDMSPSRQLLGSFQDGDDFEIIDDPIKGSDSTMSGAGANQVANKPTEGFEAALTADTIQVADQADNGSKRDTTPLPDVGTEIEVPSTPTQAAATIPLPASVHTGDHGFIDIDAIIPQTPVKDSAAHGLVKNSIINTPTPAKVTPSTVEKLKGIENLNLNTPRKRLFAERTPASKVGSAVTGNAGSGGKITPIKRERVDDEENDVVEMDTPSKKMKYQKMGSRDQPISFDSDDE